MKDQLIDTEVAIEMSEWMDAQMVAVETLTSDQEAKERARLIRKFVEDRVVEPLRIKAEQEVRAVGGRLRTDRMPEIYFRRGSHLTRGGDYLLAAARWHAEVPNAFDSSRAR
jgi:hypothetical protein